jgi:hypothetical protein
MPLALDGDGVDFYVEDDEAPELVEFEVHPELFGFREFLLHVSLLG